VLNRPLEPWRTFRWWYGQMHYSGTYWSATMQDHVIYESRLELARLIYADFDPDVTRIVAQPFLMSIDMDDARRRHVPDYLLETSSGVTVVDVKPLERTKNPKVAHVLEWARSMTEELGWNYEVWTEPPEVEYANLKFLAGYRDQRRVHRELLALLREAQLSGISISEAITHCTDWPSPLVRAGIFHLIWCGWLRTDLGEPLQSRAILQEGVR
jgi:hypothetical protein